MKAISIPQVRPVSGNTPQEAAMLFNEAMRELAPLHPTYTQDGCTFWIYYSIEYKEAESIADEY